jgi:hypothetical protein
VYSGGRVVFQRKSNYAERLTEPGFGAAEIRALMEEQHRAVIEGLRTGSIAVDLFPPPVPPQSKPANSPPAGTPAAPAAGAAHPPAVAHAPAGAAATEVTPGIRVQLLNPASWLNAGSARLLVEVRSREPEASIPDAVVEVSFEGAQRPFVFKTITDAQGRAEIGFPLPKFGPGGASLVIRASCVAGRDEIRYSLRAKSRQPGD